jgi:hypothetical protein
VGVLLGLGGLVSLWRRRWIDAVFLLACFSIQGFLAANHHLPRQWTFFIPSFLIFALWIGEGLGRIGAAFKRSSLAGTRGGATLAAVLAVLVFALPLAPFPARYRGFRDAHFGAGTLDLWRQALKQGRMGDRLGMAIGDVAQNALIVGDWEQATPLWYYQQVEGLRPDVQILYPIERLDEAAASGRPVYVTRNYPGLADRWHPSSCGALIALQPEPALDPPAGISSLHVQLGESFELVGFTYGDAEFYPTTVVPVTLIWRVLKVPIHDFSVSLRLFDSAGGVIDRVDSQNPVLGTFPTSLWTEGAYVSDYYEIQLPANLPPGTYRWGVVLYRTLPDGGWENLKVASTDDEMASGGTLEVRGRHGAGK